MPPTGPAAFEGPGIVPCRLGGQPGRSIAAAGDDDPEPPVMARVTVILDGDLNDFVPRESPGVEIERRLDGRPSAKDLLESVGFPHPEIAAITVNGTLAGFNLHVGDGDRVGLAGRRGRHARDGADAAR